MIDKGATWAKNIYSQNHMTAVEELLSDNFCELKSVVYAIKLLDLEHELS